MLKRLGDVEDSVWVFRILIQLNQLSAGAPLSPENRAAFESALQQLFTCLRECNDARRELGRLIKQHIEDVREGRSVVVSNGHIEVLEDIEPVLNRTTNSFFVAARTALYHLFGQKTDPSKGPHARSLTEILCGYNLSFAQSKKDATFEQEAAKFLLAKPGWAANHLIDVLRSDRTTWSPGLAGYSGHDHPRHNVPGSKDALSRQRGQGCDRTSQVKRDRDKSIC
jgi:hypothetical protein